MIDKTIINSHNIKLYDRNLIELSGISRIASFNSEEFNLESIMGDINIKGTGLEIVKLNTEDGNVKIKGKIDSIIYLDLKSRKREDSFLAKLFK